MSLLCVSPFSVSCQAPLYQQTGKNTINLKNNLKKSAQIATLVNSPTHALFMHCLTVDIQVPSNKITTRHQHHWIIRDAFQIAGKPVIFCQITLLLTKCRPFHDVKTSRFDQRQCERAFNDYHNGTLHHILILRWFLWLYLWSGIYSIQSFKKTHTTHSICNTQSL